MNLLYIDANIYLRFYNSYDSDYKKLLSSLNELKGKIFISRQLVDEVCRNKLSVFQKSSTGYLKQVKLTKTFLPEHLDHEEFPVLNDWNKRRKILEAEVESSNKELENVIQELLVNISNSTDKVSKELNRLFAFAKTPGEVQIQNARWRKEVGNPPGKVADPLGDQLSWEMLLSHLNNVTNLYIVTTDKDYYIQEGRKIILNPILVNDVKKVNDNIVIRSFNKLSVALKEFNETERIESLPSPEELEVIGKSENYSQESYQKKPEWFWEDQIGKPDFCPDCFNGDEAFVDIGTTVKDNQLRLKFICRFCGLIIQTVAE